MHKGEKGAAEGSSDFESWWLVRKPLDKTAKTIARNVLKHGTGAINVDACRIPTGGDKLGGGADKGLSPEGRDPGWSRPWMRDEAARKQAGERSQANVRKAERLGRWPANTVLSHVQGCERVGTKEIRGSNPIGTRGEVYSDRVWCEGGGWKGRKPSSHTDGKGLETVDDWRCVEGCPVAELDGQPGLDEPQHVQGCVCHGTKRVDVPRGKHAKAYGEKASSIYGNDQTDKGTGTAGFVDEDGKEAVPDWQCVESCPVAQLDQQSGELKSGGGDKGQLSPGVMGYGSNTEANSSPGWKPDKGGASRFFYQAKAPPSEKLGYCQACDAFVPTRQRKAHGKKAAGHDEASFVAHPTQKSLALMRWLVRLVTPPGGAVLDPFCGTGTTGVAAMLEGVRFVGVDTDRNYIRIAAQRIREALQGRGEP